MASAAPTAPALADALRGLLVASRLWARGAPIDDAAVRAVFDAAVLALHRHYVAAIPVYRRLALDLGLEEVRDAAVLASELLLSSEVFKSYDPDWIAAGRFAELTEWLATVFARRPEPVLDAVGDLDAWRAALRADGVFVTLSSGTTGAPSFVPRDATTLTALRRNGALYGATIEMPAKYRCLALTARSPRNGLEAAGAGIAGAAARAHHLGPGGWDAALAFLREAASPVVVFGAPARVGELADRARDGRLAGLPAGSLVVTGGGWKGARPLAPEELTARVQQALGVGADRVVDAYGAAELNAVLVRCPSGRYHVPPVLRVVVLDALLVPIEPQADARGRLGFLDPFAFSYPGFVMPGDVGHLVHGRCTCGLDGPALVGPIQRAGDEPPRGCAGEASAW